MSGITDMDGYMPENNVSKKDKVLYDLKPTKQKDNARHEGAARCQAHHFHPF